MGSTACTQPQRLYKSALYSYFFFGCVMKILHLKVCSMTPADRVSTYMFWNTPNSDDLLDYTHISAYSITRTRLPDFPFKGMGDFWERFTSYVSLCGLHHPSNRSFLYNSYESITLYCLLLYKPIPVAVKAKVAARLLGARVRFPLRA
jgi:hypothetical protein